MNRLSVEEIGKPRGLTLEDAFICIDKTSWLQSRAYMRADARDAELFRKHRRDQSAARLHIVDRACVGLDDADALEIAHSYLNHEPFQSWEDYVASYGADWDGA